MLQLAVKAGSVDEEDDQQGLAHFLEHMAFNGTKRFKPGELIAALESTGARLGPHVNAYTSFDETVYMFQLPDRQARCRREGHAGAGRLRRRHDARSRRDRQGARRRGRGVARRTRRGLAAARSADSGALSTSRSTPNGCRSASRRCSRRSSPERLRAFYTTWYRPDRMAVVAVGDIDPAQIEALDQDRVRRAAEAVERRARSRLRRAAPGGAAGEGGDRLRGAAVVGLDRRKRRRGEDGTVADYRRDLVHRLAFQMLNERFDELSRKPDAQFLGAGAYESGLSPTTSTVALGASVQEGKILPRAVGARDRSEPRRAARLRRRRVRPRQEVDARGVRARLHRARQDRERLLRGGVRQPLPAGRAEPGHRRTSTSCCRRCCLGSPPPT